MFNSSRTQVLRVSAVLVSMILATGCSIRAEFQKLTPAESAALAQSSSPNSATIPTSPVDSDVPTDPTSPVEDPDQGPHNPVDPLPPKPTPHPSALPTSAPSSVPSSIPSGPVPPDAACFANGAALVSLGDGDNVPNSIQVAGNAEIIGDAVVAGPGKIGLSHNPVFKGTVYAEHADAVDDPWDMRKLPVVVGSLHDFKKSIIAMSMQLSHLKPTQVAPDPSGKNTIVFQGNGGMNVIAVNDPLHIAGKQIMILRGSADDLFIFNVKSGIVFAGQSRMKLEGGVLAKNILFNLVPDSADMGDRIEIAGQAEVSGNFLSLNSDIGMAGGAHLNGSLISGQTVTVAGGAKIASERCKEINNMPAVHGN